MSKRYRKVTREELSPDQQRIWDEIGAARGGQVPTPFHILLESPDLCRHTQALGAFCRFRTGLPPRLSELVILTVATYWPSPYEFGVHTPEARKAGVPEAEIAALRDGKRPPFKDADAELAYSFAIELLEKRDVSDKTFDAAVARFGRRTVVELSGMIGYYSLLGMVMMAHRVPGPEAA